MSTFSILSINYGDFADAKIFIPSSVEGIAEKIKLFSGGLYTSPNF